MMSFGKFVVVVFTLYFFYYVGLMLWDSFKEKTKATKSGESVSFEMNGKGGNTYIEDETVDVDVDEYSSDEKKKPMTVNQVASSFAISVGNIEHQGIAVTPDMLAAIRADASVLMSSVHF